jgi:hypothetical protein
MFSIEVVRLTVWSKPSFEKKLVVCESKAISEAREVDFEESLCISLSLRSSGSKL